MDIGILFWILFIGVFIYRYLNIDKIIERNFKSRLKELEFYLKQDAQKRNYKIKEISNLSKDDYKLYKVSTWYRRPEVMLGKNHYLSSEDFYCKVSTSEDSEYLVIITTNNWSGPSHEFKWVARPKV